MKHWYQCEECGLSFDTEANCREHEAQHVGQPRCFQIHLNWEHPTGFTFGNTETRPGWAGSLVNPKKVQKVSGELHWWTSCNVVQEDIAKAKAALLDAAGKYLRSRMESLEKLKKNITKEEKQE